MRQHDSVHKNLTSHLTDDQVNGCDVKTRIRFLHLDMSSPMIYHFKKVLITVSKNLFYTQVNSKILPRVIFLISRKGRNTLRNSKGIKPKFLSYWDEKLLLLRSRLSLFDVLSAFSHFRLWSSHVPETHT